VRCSPQLSCSGTRRLSDVRPRWGMQSEDISTPPAGDEFGLGPFRGAQHGVSGEGATAWPFASSGRVATTSRPMAEPSMTTWISPATSSVQRVKLTVTGPPSRRRRSPRRGPAGPISGPDQGR